VLVTFGAIGLIVAWLVPDWRERILTSVITTLVFWKVSDALKNAFQRPRPPYWHLIHETTWSYSSGHAMFATIVYWLWAWFVWHSEWPEGVRRSIATVLALWGCGVIWSRLALGAHYVTDLVGGVLLGIVALALGAAIRAALEQRRERRRLIPV
jgi:undecaprenyl-diphosphatase